MVYDLIYYNNQTHLWCFGLWCSFWNQESLKRRRFQQYWLAHFQNHSNLYLPEKKRPMLMMNCIFYLSCFAPANSSFVFFKIKQFTKWSFISHNWSNHLLRGHRLFVRPSKGSNPQHLVIVVKKCINAIQMCNITCTVQTLWGTRHTHTHTLETQYIQIEVFTKI